MPPPETGPPMAETVDFKQVSGKPGKRWKNWSY
jgi:hypothetical protein